MVTFLNFNFLLFFILFFPLFYFFIQIHVSFFSFSFFFFFPLCFTPPHTYSSYLIHPQPHLLTFNHFLFFIVLSFCYFFSSSPSPFFNCSLFISLSNQASVPLNPTKAMPLGPPPRLYQPLVHVFFFFGSKEKIAEETILAVGFAHVCFFFFPGNDGFDECGCGWVCD